MKKVILFHFQSCPYCRAARNWLDELAREDPALACVEVERIDENLCPDIARRYDYWYVPTFYVDGVKVHEGACDKRTVERVLRSALQGHA